MSDSTPIFDKLASGTGVNNPEFFDEEPDVDPDGFDGNSTRNGGR